ncbi:MAG: DUF5131 family protein [Gemmatimonadetes bacterium]|nr:DUF5131 family protein [Gemmatimonadota bacterium]MYC90416.1 DUF5131 family protein [Gemmatimonadota bacterium]
MGQRTSIEWTEVTWNPTTGCTKVSAGCDNCYAEALSRRLLRRIYRRRLPVADTTANRADPFAVRVWPERLDQPRKWSGRRLVFVNSMSDLFHADVPPQFQRAVFRVMLEVDRHTYQVLTMGGSGASFRDGAGRQTVRTATRGRSPHDYRSDWPPPRYPMLRARRVGPARCRLVPRQQTT